MFLVNVLPHKDDSDAFYKMNQDEGLKKEFLNLKHNYSKKESDDLLDSIIELNNENGFCDFCLIKIAFSDSLHYDDSNSKTIGFISVNEASVTEHFKIGFKHLLNFGILTVYRNKGIMTSALEMRMEYFKDLEYNIMPAFVKGKNFASERVLQKCDFVKIRESIYGTTYVKRVSMGITDFNSNFNSI